MRVLLTGASSFTGAWFVHALAEHDVEVTACCRSRRVDYDPLRLRRIGWIERCCHLVEACPFGSDRFLDVLRSEGPFGVLCLHAADMGGHHRRPDLDPLAATAATTYRLAQALDLHQGPVLLTGSLFEADAGAGEPPLRAFSPYGLAKTLIWHVVRFEAERRGLPLGAFVVPSPFGPLERPGFAAELLAAWRAGAVPEVRWPRLVRDHVQVQPLAEAYAAMALSLPHRPGTSRLAPSQFAERLDLFAGRLAAEARPRLGLACLFRCAASLAPAAEPLVRQGTMPIANLVARLDPAAAWDAYLIEVPKID